MKLYSGLFIAVAHCVLRRQYRHLCTLVSVLAAVFACLLMPVTLRASRHTPITRSEPTVIKHLLAER
jgi:hypothetical protein